MNRPSGVRRLCAFVLLFAACRGEGPATATVAPAEPRPAPTTTAALDDRPRVSTGGSPVPSGALAPGTQLVTLHRGGIEMRTMIPRGQTVFHILNETALHHDLVLRSASGIVASAAVIPGGRTILQVSIADPAYVVACVTPGHAERADFATYTAGAPLKLPPAR